MMTSVVPKRILLTGGSSGIGLVTARLLMWQGHKVYTLSRRPMPDEDYPASGGSIRSLQGDVTQEATIAAALQQILSREGRLDALVCNAGNGIAGAVEDTSDSETRYQFETNFFGVANTIRVCLPALRASRGRIVVTSSVAAIAPIPYQAFYSASKAAILTYIQALRLEVAPWGVQCGCVLPGDTKTDFTDARKYTASARTGVYADRMQKAVSIMERDERNGMAPEAIAYSIANQVNRRRVKVYVVPGFSYKMLCFLMRHLPARFVLWTIGKVYGL